MKNLKKIIIDFNSLNIVLNQKRTIIKEVKCKHDIKDAKKILDFLIENKDIKIFINDHLNIRNIESLYCQLNDFIYSLNKSNKLPKDINYSLLTQNIKDISFYSPSYCMNKLLNQDDINDKQKYHFFNVLNYDEETLSEYISNYIKLKIKKTDISLKEILDNIQNQFKKIDVIYKIKRPENFIQIFNKLSDMKSQDIFNPLCKDIDDVFSDLIKKVNNKEINLNEEKYKSSDFFQTIFGSIIEYLRIKNNDETLFLNELKKYNNIFDFFLNIEKNITIHKIIFEKNETIEKRIVASDKKYVAYNYLKNIISKLKKTNSDEKIISEVQNNFKSIFEMIKKTPYFINFMSLFKVNIDFIYLINKDNVTYSENDDFSSTDKKYINNLLNNYTQLIFNNPENLFTKYSNLLDVMNSCETIPENFLVIMDNLKDEKYLEILRKKYSYVYTLYLVNSYKKIKDPLEQFKKINQNRGVREYFINDDNLIVDFLGKLKPSMCSIEIENFLSTSVNLIIYLYICRKKLSAQSEQIISSDKKAFNLYKELLSNKNIFNDFDNINNFASYVYETIYGFED